MSGNGTPHRLDPDRARPPRRPLGEPGRDPLLDELGAMLDTFDPVPEAVLAAAAAAPEVIAAFDVLDGWGSLQVLLDTATEPQPVGVRGGPRLVTFGVAVADQPVADQPVTDQAVADEPDAGSGGVAGQGEDPVPGDDELEVSADAAVRPAGELTVEVEVGEEPTGALRLVGLVVPAAEAELEVCSPGRSVRVRVDRFGRFQAGGVPAGPLRLVLHAVDARPIRTEWITL
jgi:hypothetical protein